MRNALEFRKNNPCAHFFLTQARVEGEMTTVTLGSCGQKKVDLSFTAENSYEFSPIRPRIF